MQKVLPGVFLIALVLGFVLVFAQSVVSDCSLVQGAQLVSCFWVAQYLLKQRRIMSRLGFTQITLNLTCLVRYAMFFDNFRKNCGC